MLLQVAWWEPGIPNLQRLKQLLAEYVFLAGKGQRPMNVESYMLCSSQIS